MHRPPRVLRRHRRRGDHRAAQRGFTLVELVISAGLLAFLALAATFFWVDNFRLVLTLNEDSAAIADGRAVLERISREIREIKFDATSGAFCIISPMTATTQIVFNKTSGAYAIGCGGATPTTTHNDFAVTIQQPASSSTINLTYTGTLASTTGVNALTAYSGTTAASALKIVYLDKNSNVTTSTAAVRYVQLTLSLQPPNAPLTKTSTLVALRNN